MKRGILYVVATPIGNLSDFTYRAVEILKEVDFIICEDTRITSKLLNKYEIRNKLVSFNAHQESKKINSVISRILNGEKAAIVSDAGTPCISDPGVRLINAARRNEIEISGAPGPNAAVYALSIAGLPTDKFFFYGFLPQKKGRRKSLQEISLIDSTIVIYESTYRIEKLIRELDEFLPEREIAVCRELTKKFEEVKRGKPQEIINLFSGKSIKGEFVVIVAPADWEIR